MGGYISGNCDRAQVRGFLLWVHHDVCRWARHGRAERTFMGNSIHIGHGQNRGTCCIRGKGKEKAWSRTQKRLLASLDRTVGSALRLIVVKHRSLDSPNPNRGAAGSDSIEINLIISCYRQELCSRFRGVYTRNALK